MQACCGSILGPSWLASRALQRGAGPNADHLDTKQTTAYSAFCQALALQDDNPARM